MQFGDLGSAPSQGAGEVSGDFLGDRCITRYGCACLQRKAKERDQLLSAAKEWRQATESRLRLLDSRGEAAKVMLKADADLIAVLERVER
jgi:hypothetical protein